MILVCVVCVENERAKARDGRAEPVSKFSGANWDTGGKRFCYHKRDWCVLTLLMPSLLNVMDILAHIIIILHVLLTTRSTDNPPGLMPQFAVCVDVTFSRIDVALGRFSNSA